MILIPAQLESYRSLKDRTIKICFETQELTPEQVGSIQSLLNKIGYLAFKGEEFNSSEVDNIENLKSEYNDTSKTPSQRLRGVLWHNFNKDNEGFKTFPAYYDNKMEVLINHFKSKLD